MSKDGKWELMSYVLSGIIVTGFIVLSGYVVSNYKIAQAADSEIRKDFNDQLDKLKYSISELTNENEKAHSIISVQLAKISTTLDYMSKKT